MLPPAARACHLDHDTQRRLKLLRRGRGVRLRAMAGRFCQLHSALLNRAAPGDRLPAVPELVGENCVVFVGVRMAERVQWCQKSAKSRLIAVNIMFGA